MLWLFVGPTGVDLLDFFCSGIQVFFTVESLSMLYLLVTRGDQEVRGKQLPFLHRLINSAGITAHNTATYTHLICYKMLDVSRLRALQLSSRQRYIAWTGPFYVVFWRFITQPIKLQRFVKLCYAVIAHIAYHAYLTTYLLLFYANFHRFISNWWFSKSKRITVLSKRKNI